MNLLCHLKWNFLNHISLKMEDVWGVFFITTPQLHSSESGLRFCAGSNPARRVSEIHDGEDLWQWSRMEIRLNAFRRSTIPQKNPKKTNKQNKTNNQQGERWWSEAYSKLVSGKCVQMNHWKIFLAEYVYVSTILGKIFWNKVKA